MRKNRLLFILIILIGIFVFRQNVYADSCNCPIIDEEGYFEGHIQDEYNLYKLSKLATIYNYSDKMKIDEYYIVNNEYAIAIPKKEGYYFSGWYLDENFEQILGNSTSTKIDKNTILYGKWLKEAPNNNIITSKISNAVEINFYEKYSTCCPDKQYFYDFNTKSAFGIDGKIEKLPTLESENDEFKEYYVYKDRDQSIKTANVGSFEEAVKYSHDSSLNIYGKWKSEEKDYDVKVPENLKKIDIKNNSSNDMHTIYVGIAVIVILLLALIYLIVTNKNKNNDKIIIGIVLGLVLAIALTTYLLINNTSKQNKELLLNNQILKDNEVISVDLDFSKEAFENSKNKSGLYKMSVTNGFGGTNKTKDTYFFYGDVKNNIVIFANKVWRIIRINEDGTIRLILDSAMDDNLYRYSYDENTSYYSDSDLKKNLDNWYRKNITSEYANKVATGNYFCEAAKVKSSGTYSKYNRTEALVPSDQYIPNLKCEADSNGKSYVNDSVGLITYDEAVLAGSYEMGYGDFDTYLTHGMPSYIGSWWTMSFGGMVQETAKRELPYVWYVNKLMIVSSPTYDYRKELLRPVINLKADTIAVKDENGYYIVQ